MPNSSLRRVIVCAVTLVCLSACYDSPVPLDDPSIELDAALLGSWTCVPPALAETPPDERASMLIEPFDDLRYLVEWEVDGRRSRYCAYATAVGETTLLNVRELGGSAWIFVHYRIDQFHLSFALVNGQALENVEASAALREIRERAGDENLYEKYASCARVAR